MTLPAFAAAALAGGAAAVVRHLITRAFGPMPFPWAVLLVNVLGSAIGGVLLGLALEGALPAEWALVVLAGVAGGLTTFSTLAVDTVELARTNRWRWALGNVVGSLALGIGAVCAACGLTVALL